MACCLTAPSHYLNQCWLLISQILWHSPESNFTLTAHATILYNEFENHTFKIPATSPRGEPVNCVSCLLQTWSHHGYLELSHVGREHLGRADRRGLGEPCLGALVHCTRCLYRFHGHRCVLVSSAEWVLINLDQAWDFSGFILFQVFCCYQNTSNQAKNR